MQIRIGLPLRSAWFEWPWGCSRDLEAMQMSRWCANSMRHQPSACAMLRRSAACVLTPEPGERRPSAPEATGEKQLLRLERPSATGRPVTKIESSSASMRQRLSDVIHSP